MGDGDVTQPPFQITIFSGSDDEITPEEVKKKAEGQKAKGNDALKAKDFKTAIRHYTMVLLSCSSLPSILTA